MHFDNPYCSRVFIFALAERAAYPNVNVKVANGHCTLHTSVRPIKKSRICSGNKRHFQYTGMCSGNRVHNKELLKDETTSNPNALNKPTMEDRIMSTIHSRHA